jgi:hypothetical protein
MQAYDRDLKRIEKLLADLGGAGSQGRGPSDLLLEHIEAARRYLVGSMPGEYIVSLEQAHASLGCIADKHTRSEARKVLRSAIDSKVQ